MSTPTQIKQDRAAAFQWHRLLTELNLPPDTRWEVIATAMRDFRLIADGAEAEINRLRAELREARSGVRELAF